MITPDNSREFAGIRRIMVFIDGGYLRKYLKDMFGSDNIDFSLFITLLAKQFSSSMSLSFELIRTYYYDAITDQQDPVKFNEQESYLQKIRGLDGFEIRLGRLKKNGAGSYRQKGVDTLIAIDMLTKAYGNQYDIAIMLSGDEDMLDVAIAVKNTGKRVYGVFFINHISSELRDVFDRRLGLDRRWIEKIRK